MTGRIIGTRPHMCKHNYSDFPHAFYDRSNPAPFGSATAATATNTRSAPAPFSNRTHCLRVLPVVFTSSTSHTVHPLMSTGFIANASFTFAARLCRDFNLDWLVVHLRRFNNFETGTPPASPIAFAISHA